MKLLRRLLFIFDIMLLPKLLWKSRTVLWELVRRNVATRYKGAILGGVWSLVQPLLMLCVYTFVFSVIFKARWGTDVSDAKGAFAIVMFCGMALYTIFAESVSSSCSVILSNQNYVQKVIFPLEVLPLVQVLTSFILGTVWFVLLFIGAVFVFGTISWTMFLLLPILLILFLFSLGISYFVASLGVYIRDTAYVLQVILQILFFMTPIFYPVTAVPVEYRLPLQINPLTILIEETRKVFLHGQLPDWVFLGISLLVSLIVLQLGFAFFHKTQKGFADVL